MIKTQDIRKLLYIPNSVQDPLIQECCLDVLNNLNRRVGGVIGLHGDVLSGKSMIARRVISNPSVGNIGVGFVDMAVAGLYHDFRQVILRAFHLPADIPSWPPHTLMPKFMDYFLRISPVKILVFDDFHDFSLLSLKQQEFLYQFIKMIITPPYCLTVLIAGDLTRLPQKSVDWGEIENKKLLLVSEFLQEGDIRSFVQSLMMAFCSIRNLTIPESVLSIIEHSTGGLVGEIVRLMRMVRFAWIQDPNARLDESLIQLGVKRSRSHHA